MEKLGKYVILGELGRGAGGIVYRARDPIINRLVALKTITTGLAEFPDLLQRFYQEAQSAGGLQHPNIVTIFDMGDEGGIPYIAMELVDGETLDQLIARKATVTSSVKLMYVYQACRAFDYAHKRGIVHRDIKPDNVMVTRDGTIKVVDFGIARVLGTSRTQTGMLLGTFAYMSPEQYHGEHADARSDIWSFGVLMYELLAYQRPFKGQTPASLMHSICQQDSPPLNEVLPGCPPALEKVSQRTLQKAPGDRYQSMEELLLDLDPICKSLQSESIDALMAESHQCAEKGDYAQARDLLYQVLQIESTHAPARAFLEKVNFELRKVQVRPRAQLHVETGLALLSQGKTQEAKAEAEMALKLDSTFEPAHDLEKLIEEGLRRAKQLADWMEASQRRLAAGNPEEAESLAAKILELDPGNQQARALHQQARDEKAERQRRAQLSEKMNAARKLWTQQKFAECIELLTAAQQDFPKEEEILRLLESAREDQANQKKQQGLAEARRLLANQTYAECLSLLADLQKQFQDDEEIAKLQKKAREDQAKQRRSQGLAEARNLLADRRFDDAAAKLSALQNEFPQDAEISKFQKKAGEDQKKYALQRSLEEAKSLLAARRYADCISFLASLAKEFPGEEEIARFLQTATEENAEQQRRQGVLQARKSLSAKNYDEAIKQLLDLQKQFPKDEEIPKLIESSRREIAELRKSKGLAEARNLLAAKNHEASLALLANLQKEYPGDREVSKLADAVREDQAEQKKSRGLAEARTLFSSRRYDESIALLLELQKTFPAEEEIAKLLETVRDERSEQQKQQALSDARGHLAARRFAEARALVEKLGATHPKDTSIQKLHSLIVQEQQKQASLERLQAELKAVKALVGEKKYSEVLSRSEKALKEFPANADLLRMVEFARSQQTQIERQERQTQILQSVKRMMQASQFEAAFNAALEGLQAFPENSELQFLREQADKEQRKVETRQHIEQRVKEIRFKINRGNLSEAIDLANETLMTMGPDTDVTQLLNSARVEYLAREKKREQDEKLTGIRTQIGAGDFDGATKTLDEAISARALEAFDPRVQKVSDEIATAKASAASAAEAKPSTPAASLSKEYAWLQPPPVPEAPPSEDSHADTNVPEPKASASVQPAPPATPSVAPHPVSVPPAPAKTAPKPPKPPKQQAPTPPSDVPAQPVPVRETKHEPIAPAIPRTEPSVVGTSIWKKPATIGVLAVGTLALLWGIYALVPRNVTTRDSGSTASNSPSTKPAPPSLESRQRDALNATDKLVAANDLDGALRTLTDAAALNGPLNAEIQKKRASIEESLQNQALRDLRHKEEQLWQQAQDDTANARFTQAQKALRQILALGDGGIRKSDAQQYLTRTIPARQQEESLFQRAEQASRKGELAGLQTANNLFGEVIARDGQRKAEAQQFQKDVRSKLTGLCTTAAEQDLQRGDFKSARGRINSIQQVGADSSALSAEIDKAEQARLSQLEAQFNQLRQSDDEASAQQLSGLQRGFQALADSAGPKADEAKGYLGNLSAAVREVHDRVAAKRAEAAYQQVAQKSQQALNSSEKSALESSRNALQTFAQSGGPHAADAQKLSDQVSAKLAALDTPPPPPADVKPPTPPPGTADRDAVLALVNRYAQAFDQRNADALRQIWPNIGKRYAGFKTSFESASSIQMNVQTDSVTFSSDGNVCTVTSHFTSEFTPQNQKPRTAKGQTIFQFAKVNGSWIITDVQ